MENQTQMAAEAKQKTLELQVRYIGARRRYEDPHASVNETLSSIKPKVLDFFGLSETPGQQGGKVYTFALGGTPLTDPSVTLGRLAEGRHELKLDLIEQLEQG
ncbi:MAG: hypothetical protein HY067_11795 [Betaproteobacteria bacterium]|nr:hypothetical protein [Betaproteobacteria bacterium]